MAPQKDVMSDSGKKRLMKEFGMLMKESDLHIKAVLSKNEHGEEMINEWDLFIAGPPGTLYENYTLHAKMYFPPRYPFLPPKFRFVTPMFHPNIYTDGIVCISILHTDRDDPTESENDNCTWTPGQNVRTVCLSIISLLSSPNIYSPANVDASKMLRDDEAQYSKIVTELLEKYRRSLDGLVAGTAQDVSEGSGAGGERNGQDASQGETGLLGGSKEVHGNVGSQGRYEPDDRSSR